MAEHCVQIVLKLSDDKYGASQERDTIYEFEDALEKAIEAAKAGEFDGNEFGGGTCTLFMYGPDADKLFNSIRPVIEAHASLTAGGHAIKRYGPPEDGVSEIKIDL